MAGGPKPRPSNHSSELPQPPSWLSDAELELWGQIVPELACSVDLAPSDALALGDLVTCLHRLNAAEKDITERGLIVKGHRGVMGKNPSVSVARAYRDSLLWYSKQFGLDPLSRTKVPKSIGGKSPLEAARERLQARAAGTVQ